MGSTPRLSWGQREFASATAGVRATGYLGALKTIIGLMCIGMVVLGIIVQLHPQAPTGLPRRLVHATVLASAAVAGLLWIRWPWPSYRRALAWVIWADVSIAICATVMAAPSAQLNTTIHMGLVGVFAAFLLGWRIIAVHCAFATIVIVGLTARAVAAGQASLLDLYIYYDPALTSVVVLPVIIQTIIEAGRRSIGQTNRQAIRDPLTGLLNRRGIHAAVHATLDTLASSTLIAVAVVDLDHFKKLNDTHGHRAGDSALREIAHQLQANIRHDGDLVARTGGDEFIIIAYLDTHEGLHSFIDRCSALHDNPTLVSTSIGIAWRATCDNHFDFDNLLHHADTAMYQAKRGGGKHVVVHTDPTI